MSPLLPLERAALSMILEGDHPVLNTLRVQLDFACVQEREFTGAGSYTALVVPPDVPTLATTIGSPPLGNVVATGPGVVHGIGFVLYVKWGALSLLEAYLCGDDVWPTETNGFVLSHAPGYAGSQEFRDALDRLSQRWA